MKGLETGKRKIQEICDHLKRETLEPAKQEAREIVENAHLQASVIVKEATEKAEQMIQEAKRDLEEKARVFHASLQLACRQGVEQLKQQIEKELFNRELASLIEKELRNPKVIGEILNAFLKVIEERGIEDEFRVLIPQGISPRSINALLVQNFLEKLDGKSVVIGDFTGGVQIQMKGRNMTIDISDGAVSELLGRYMRSDFRDLVFHTA